MKLLVTLFSLPFYFRFDIRLEGGRGNISEQSRKSDKQCGSQAVFTIYSHVTTAVFSSLLIYFSSLVIHCRCLFLSPSNLPPPPGGITSLMFDHFSPPGHENMFRRLSFPPARHPPLWWCCPLTLSGSVTNDNCSHTNKA